MTLWHLQTPLHHKPGLAVCSEKLQLHQAVTAEHRWVPWCHLKGRRLHSKSLRTLDDLISLERLLSGPHDGLHTWISSIPTGPEESQKERPQNSDESASYFFGFPRCILVLKSNNRVEWPAISRLYLSWPGTEELWSNLCFKENTNKCKQSVSKASVQLLVSWSPLHCNVCLSILATAEDRLSVKMTSTNSITTEGRVCLCTSYYN